MTVVVIGGAGYIGAHVVRLLRASGTPTLVIDDLSTGQATNLSGAPLVQLDVAADDSSERLADVLSAHGASSVIQFAAKKKPAESVVDPIYYYRQNVGGMMNVLHAMDRANVREIVFSSSAAVYGETTTPLIGEDHATSPCNPYGETKLVGEWLGRNSARSLGINFIALRYFNVAGAGWPDLGDPGSANLIPMVFDQLENGRKPIIFGDDYPTADGTCVRDFVHVLDLADAHVDALGSLHGTTPTFAAYNIGTGMGHSVREVIDLACQVAGADPAAVDVAPRRPGDPAMVVASAERARQSLGWAPRHNIRDMISSSWEARHPKSGSASPEG